VCGDEGTAKLVKLANFEDEINDEPVGPITWPAPAPVAMLREG
jgi:hypothetical protein